MFGGCPNILPRRFDQQQSKLAETTVVRLGEPFNYSRFLVIGLTDSSFDVVTVTVILGKLIRITV